MIQKAKVKSFFIFSGQISFYLFLFFVKYFLILQSINIFIYLYENEQFKKF